MITVTTWFAVALGGAIGAPARFLLDRWVNGVRGGSQFPWGVFVVNCVGSALAGVVLVTTTGDLRVLLLAGFCGGFTTFSGYAWDVDRLWPSARGAFWWAVIATPSACVALFLVAWRLASFTSG